MRSNAKNAVKIKCRNLVLSPSVELLLLLSFISCLVLILWPEIAGFMFDKKISLAGNAFLIELSIMILCTVIMLTMTLMVTRIGAQAGFEKGNKLTEYILTSITRRELFFSHLSAGCFIIMIDIFIICIPIALSKIFSWKLSIIVSNIKFTHVLLIIIHVLAVSIFYTAIAISLTSRVKKNEDTGIYLAMLMLPNIISQVYYCIKGGLYIGSLYILNYIPLFSMITGLGAILKDTVRPVVYFLIIIADLIWSVIAILAGCIIYEKNIEVR